jgi:hypothetical protein
MSTNGSSVPERIARWKVTTAGLRPILTEVPHLVEIHGELEDVTLQSEELDARHEALKAETREVNRIREELARTGDDLRQRLGAALKTRYGFTSKKLIEFGFKPRPARRQPPAPQTPPEQPGPEATPPPAETTQKTE